MFTRIRFILAAFERGEFSERGLAARLEQFTERNNRAVPERKQTTVGLIAWSEP